MRKSNFLIFLMIFIMHQISFSTIEKPWNKDEWINKNPIVVKVGRGGYMNIVFGEKTINSIDPEGAEGIEDAKKIVEEVGKMKNKEECIEKLIGVFGIESKMSVDEINSIDKRDEIVLVGGKIETMAYFLINGIREYTGVAVSERGMECVNYFEKWRTALDRYVDLVNGYAYKTKIERENLKQEYENAKRIGICEVPNEEKECLLAREAHQTGDLMKYESDIREKVWDNVPIMVPIYDLYNAYKNANDEIGIVIKALKEAEKRKTNEAIENVEDILKRTEDLEKEMKKLESERIYKIEKIPLESGVWTKEESIADEYFSIRNETLKLKQEGKVLKVWMDSRPDGYVFLILNKTESIYDVLGEIEQRYENLEMVSNEAVEHEMEKAKGMLNEAKEMKIQMSEETEELLSEAEKLMEKKGSLGERYENYKKAQWLIGKAMATDESGQVEYEAEKKLVSDMILEFKDEGIDVQYEEGMFKSLKGRDDVILESVKESLKKKCGMEYADVKSSIERIESEIFALPKEMDYLKEQFVKIKNSAEKAYECIHPSKMEAVRGDIDDLEKTMEKELKEISKKTLKAENKADILLWDAETGDSVLRIEVKISNPSGIEIGETKKSVDVGEVLNGNAENISIDKTSGIGSVILNGENIEIEIKGVGPWEQESVVILARVKGLVEESKKEKSTMGKLGVVEETMNEEIDAPTGIWKIQVLGEKDVEVDGEEYYGQWISPGKHAITIKNPKAGGYEKTYGVAYVSNAGLYGTVVHEVNITPNISTDRIEEGVVASPGGVEHVEIYPYTINGLEVLQDGFPEYRFAVLGLDADSTAVIRIEETIKNDTKYAEEKVKYIKDKYGEEENPDLIYAENLIKENRSKEAIVVLDKIERESEKKMRIKQREEAKVEKIKEKISREILEIDAALDILGNESSVRKELEKRRELLSEAMENGEMAEDIDLKWRDKIIKKVKKEAEKTVKEAESKYPEKLKWEIGNLKNRIIEMDIMRRYGDVARVEMAEEEVNTRIKEMESEENALKEQMLKESEELLNNYSIDIDRYLSLKKEAGTGRYAEYFSLDAKKLKKELGSKEVKKEELEKAKEKMRKIREVVEYFKEESGRRAEALERAFGEIKEVKKIKDWVKGGQYVKAMQLSDLLASKNIEEKKGENWDVVLTAIGAVIAAIAFGVYATRKNREEKEELKELEDI